MGYEDYFLSKMSSNKKLETFYIWGIKIIIFLIPFLPLYVSPSMMFAYITGKNFAFRISVELATVLWLGLIVSNKEYRPRSSTMFLLILTFTFIVGLADLSGINPYKSFWSNYERMEGYLTILHLTFYFMIIKSILRTKNDWIVFLNIFLIAGMFVSSHALYQKFVQGYAYRLYGIVGNPPFLASYLLLITQGYVKVMAKRAKRKKK